MFAVHQIWIGMKSNNQLIYNELMTEQIVKQKEIKALRQDYKYRLTRVKEYSSYKIVEDKSK